MPPPSSKPWFRLTRLSLIVIAEVCAALGYEAQWTKLKQIRAQLIGGAAAETTASPPAVAPAE